MSDFDSVAKKIQYIAIDSEYVDGSNNAFSVTLGLKSNLHLESLGSVIAVKPVEFYLTQVGSNDAANANNIAKFVDVICPEIPKTAQILDERNGQIFFRAPLERHFSGSNQYIVRDKQWKPFARQVNYFNPISLRKLTFKVFEFQDDGEYLPLNPAAKFHMVLEVTTIDHKRKPPNREVEILQCLERLLKKIDTLNENVRKLPEKPAEEKKKYSFGSLVALVLAAFGAFLWWINRGLNAAAPVAPGIPIPVGIR